MLSYRICFYLLWPLLLLFGIESVKIDPGNTAFTPLDSNKTGVFAFWGLIATLSLIYLMNMLGPPPPSEGAIAVAGNALWLFVLWGYWVDKHRRVR